MSGSGPAAPDPRRRTRLDEAGRPWADLAREMDDLARGDLDWRRGRHAAFVWHAGEAVERVARDAHARFMTENGLGLRVFPSLRRMEADVVDMVADLLHAPAGAAGHMTSGGTESIFLAAHAAREWARRTRPGATPPEIVAATSAHPAIDKAAHYLGMNVVRVPTGADFRADPAAMAAAVGPRTVMLYGSAPAYSLGVVDPIAALGALAAERGLWLHVDACVGGILAPFVAALGYPVPLFDFRAPGVVSISADLHKSGYAAKGASVLLFRDAERQAAGRYDFDRWPTGRYSTHTFTGTRPGGPIAAAWAVMRFLGREGYREIARTVMDARARLEAGLAALPGAFHVWGAPELWAVAYGARGVDIGAVADAMETRGWSVGRVREPRALHLMLTPVHAPRLDEYLRDLAASAGAARARGATPSSAVSGYH